MPAFDLRVMIQAHVPLYFWENNVHLTVVIDLGTEILPIDANLVHHYPDEQRVLLMFPRKKLVKKLWVKRTLKETMVLTPILRLCPLFVLDQVKAGKEPGPHTRLPHLLALVQRRQILHPLLLLNYRPS